MSIKSMYADGWKLHAVNRVLVRNGYPKAKKGYLVNIINEAAGADCLEHHKLYEEIEQELDDVPEYQRVSSD